MENLETSVFSQTTLNRLEVRDLLAALVELAGDDDHGSYSSDAIDELRRKARAIVVYEAQRSAELREVLMDLPELSPDDEHGEYPSSSVSTIFAEEREVLDGATENLALFGEDRRD